MKNVCLLTLVSTVCVIGTASADYITGVTIEDFFSESDYNGRNAIEIINGEGFEVNGPGTHRALATEPDEGMWQSDGYNGHSPDGDVVDNQYFVFDLGAQYDLASTTVWNYNSWYGISYGYEGVDEMEILVSPDNVNYTSMGLVNVSEAPGDDYIPFGDTFTLNVSGVRYVRFDINSDIEGNPLGFVGLSEVRFTEIPEPATMVLLGLGGLGLLRRRRA